MMSNFVSPNSPLSLAMKSGPQPTHELILIFSGGLGGSALRDVPQETQKKRIVITRTPKEMVLRRDGRSRGVFILWSLDEISMIQRNMTEIVKTWSLGHRRELAEAHRRRAHNLPKWSSVNNLKGLYPRNQFSFPAMSRSGNRP